MSSRISRRRVKKKLPWLEALEDRRLLCTTQNLPADVTNDCRVDFADFLKFSQDFGKNVAKNTNGDLDGSGVIDFPDFTIFTRAFNSFQSTNDVAAPLGSLFRIVGAASTGNTSVIVSFSGDVGPVLPENFVIVQENVNSEAGAISVIAAQVRPENRRIIELTTSSQNEVTYTVNVVGVTDTQSQALAPVQISSGVRVDPTSATFAGTPPNANGTLLDTDGDGLTDNEESRGWEVTVKLANGETFTEEVTSDPQLADSDNDGLTDAEEKKLRSNPRDRDTDDDQIEDARELNEVFSSIINQDTDGDGINDSREFNFFRTSPSLKDTDGDQIPDNEEVCFPIETLWSPIYQSPPLKLEKLRFNST